MGTGTTKQRESPTGMAVRTILWRPPCITRTSRVSFQATHGLWKDRKVVQLPMQTPQKLASRRGPQPAASLTRHRATVHPVVVATLRRRRRILQRTSPQLHNSQSIKPDRQIAGPVILLVLD